MTSAYRNRLKTYIAFVYSSGLGDFITDNAVSGYRTFGPDEDLQTFDGILIQEGTAWELRDGCVYDNTGEELTRGTLVDSSTGSAIAFTDAAIISQVGTADMAQVAELAMASTIPGGRLTLESGVPVSTTDQTAKTSIYYTPFVNNVVPLWDGYKWRPIEFSETTLALGTLTSGKPYDVFGYLSGGALALELLAWTDDSTRATAVTIQDGRYCKSGDKTRLLLGTFYTTSTTTTADSESYRYLSNVYNQVCKRLVNSSTSSHTYTTGSWREWNGGTGINKCNFVSALPLNTVPCSLNVNMQISAAGTVGYANIDYDSTTGTNRLITNLEAYLGAVGSIALSGAAIIANPVGRHYFTAVQYGSSNVTYAAMTLYGDFQC